MAGYGAMAAALYVYAQRAYRLPFQWRRAGGTALLALGLYAAWQAVPALQRWWAEAALLLVYTGGLVGIGVVPRGLFARLWRRPARPVAPPEAPGASQRTGAQLADLAAGLLTQWVSPRSIFQQRTTVSGLHDSQGNPVPLVAGGRKVFAFAGIGNPNGFLHTVQSLGMHVSAALWLNDHHHYRLPRDLVALTKAAATRRPDAAHAATCRAALPGIDRDRTGYRRHGAGSGDTAAAAAVPGLALVGVLRRHQSRRRLDRRQRREHLHQLGHR